MPRHPDRERSYAMEAGKPGGNLLYREQLSEKFRRATVGWSVADQLHEAVKRRKTAEVNVLFDTGVVPDEKTLELAVEMRWAAAVEAFIKRGTAPTQFMLDRARENNDLATAKVLLESGIVPGGSEMTFAAWRKNPEWLLLYLDHGGTPTPHTLFSAATVDNKATGDILLNRGVIADAETVEYLARNKRTLWMEAVLSHGAQPTPCALDIAVRNKDTDTLSALLRYGKVVPARATLEYAVRKKEADLARIFIDRGTVPTPEMLEMTKDKMTLQVLREGLAALEKKKADVGNLVLRADPKNAPRKFVLTNTLGA